jgi:hypothetical protein
MSIPPVVDSLGSLQVSPIKRQHKHPLAQTRKAAQKYRLAPRPRIPYLVMIRDGYVWADHFEQLKGGAAGVTATPDFVFSRPNDAAVALVESKGTRSARQNAFETTVGGHVECGEQRWPRRVRRTATRSHGV